MFRLKEVKYKNILDIKSLEIPINKVTCIVGESGSGKTTLLRLLNKLISYDSGEIYYNNKPLSDLDSISLRREVIMLPQTPAIFDGTIKDNLLIGLKFSEKQFVEDNKLYQILKTVKLNKDLDVESKSLSGGEKQRLALGRVILLEPEVYLLDEPSSALDEETETLIIKELVIHTKTNNKTLIMVTHSKRIAKNFADNIIEVKEGKIVSEGGLKNE